MEEEKMDGDTQSEKYQDFREFIRKPATQMASEKVASTVATFSLEDRTGSLYKRVIRYSYRWVGSEHMPEIVNKLGPEKVPNTVGTFLIDISLN